MAIGALIGLLLGGAVGISIGMIVQIERDAADAQPRLPTARQRRAWKRERLDINPALRSRK
jgi:hypothetical protein